MMIPANIWKAWRAAVLLGNPYEHSAYAGELRLDSCGISVPCIEVDAYNFDLSELAIDREHCAAKMWCSLPHVEALDANYGTWVIGNHNWQGFSAIRDCQKGDEAILVAHDGTEHKYIVMDMFEGYIDEHGSLRNQNGDSFLKAEPENIVLMTCYPDADVPAEKGDRRFFVYLELVV